VGEPTFFYDFRAVCGMQSLGGARLRQIVWLEHRNGVI
jgi:hypothetical protein